MSAPHSEQPSIWIGSDRDTYAAANNLHVHHGGENFGPAGQVSIAPRQLAYPVRGRQGVVDALLTAPCGTVHVVCGTGGSGKTTVALAVAAQARARGAEVWQLSAVDAATFDAHLRALAVRLGVGVERLRLAWSGSSGDAPDLVWEALERRVRPWLLIVDNADDLTILAGPDGHVEDGNGWIRRPPAPGRLLITSRNQNHEAWGSGATLHTLDVLSRGAATELLLDRAPRAGPGVQAAALADRLGHLPLLLHHAGLYLSRADRNPSWPDAPRCPGTFGAYHLALDDRLHELLDSPTARPSHLHGPRATATWEVTLDLLAGQRLGHTRPLLRLLAHFGDAPIPYTEVLPCAALRGSPLFRLPAGADLQQAVNALADYALVTTRAPGSDAHRRGHHTVTLHPLVAEVTRQLDDVRRDRGEYLALVARGLRDGAARHDPRNPSDWPFWDLATAHLHSLIQQAQDAEESGPDAETVMVVALACIEYARDAGLYDLAEVTAERAAAVCASLPADGRTALRLRRERAQLACLAGDFTAAASEYRALLGIQRRTLPGTDPQLLETQHFLAHVLNLLGDLDGAQAAYRAVLAGRSRVLGAGHIDTLWTRHNLAWIAGQRGDLAAAEAEYRAVLAERSRLLGRDHPHTLYTRHALAWVLARRGDLTAAEAEYRAVLADRSRLLGRDHPHTLHTRHARAWVLGRRGDLTAAETEYRAVLDGQVRLLGEAHPHTLSTARALDELRHRAESPSATEAADEDPYWWGAGGGGS
ncbi:tetratricopeptide repeat protein [Streptomyces sp. NPDC058308]|uniref:tetratricopeptide repeat protein n=1 Tax=Streptomyces sp. NPDC058308 TaxID=3346440 RepID=UPI0036E2D5EB